MAQGTIKKTKPKPASSLKKSDPGSKRGARAIAPKKAGLIKKKKLDKKLSAGLTARTERSLAEKAGHLEMLSGGKKQSKKEEKGNKKKSAGAKTK